MILDKLVLNNFGVYRGNQEFILKPPSSDKPVILIGGLNGGGKTTFLDAIHLVLYGKRADCISYRTAYDTYLSESIHRGVPRTEGASLELSFRHSFEGEVQSFRVKRSWYPRESKIRENLEVYRQGNLDEVITETWGEFVEEFMPLGISDLFFFDGEKIARFAEVEDSSKLLESAIHTLLGLDIVDQLATDLVALERRKKTVDASKKERHRIEVAKEELNRVKDELDNTTDLMANVNTELDAYETQLAKVEERYRIEGGELYEAREEIEEEYKILNKQIGAAEAELRTIASGCAPLLMVPGLVSAAIERDVREQESFRAELLQSTLTERDDRVLANLRASNLEDDVQELVKELLEKERKSLTANEPIERLLQLDEETRQKLNYLKRVELPRTKNLVEEKKRSFEALQEEEVRIERKIAAIPESAAIEALVDERNELRELVAPLRERKEFIRQELERLSARHMEAEERLKKCYENLARAEVAKDDAKRILDHSKRVRDTLKSFREKVTRQHIERIEEFVLDSFKQLLRKQGLIAKLKIDPQSYELQLLDAQDREIVSSRLSAGERQLLAVSLLWGLARASGRPLPTIVDTPLGRLDSTHRLHLLKRYFPYASHQVILLSTDEEIDARYYERLKPSIGHEYTLEFDDEAGATNVRKGYHILGAEYVA